FDDGLSSAFRHVFPLLRERATPATFFISTGHLEHGSLLWFCYLSALCFERVYERVYVNGVSFSLLTLEEQKRAWHALVRLVRANGDPRAFCKILESAYPLPPWVKTEYEGMTREQLADFAGCDFLEGGGHTISHPYLHELSRKEQAEEIGQ